MADNDIKFMSDVVVTILGFAGSDAEIADAARVSSDPQGSLHSGTRNEGLINTLLKKKHGSPFEHNMLKFYVKAPIFAFREFQRHRIGFSYNEMSGRYSKLLPEFYIPADDRPLINDGSSMNPHFVAADPPVVTAIQALLMDNYRRSWRDYEEMINLGIANEVARSVLPVAIMSQMIATCNVRSLLHFLALRIDDEKAMFPSKPQYEIQMVAQKMEAFFAELFPLTYKAFNENGRVAP